MNVQIMGPNGVCNHNREDVLQALGQFVLVAINTGPAVVAVVKTDEAMVGDDVSVRKALLNALLKLEEQDMD